MAYGEEYSPEELEYTEILFRVEDLSKDWFRAFLAYVQARSGDDAAERLALELTEQRLEEAAMELSLQLKARRLAREGRLDLLGPEGREGAA